MIPDGWTEMPLKEVFKLGSGDSRPKDLRPGPQDDHTSPVYGGNGILGYSRDHNSTGDDIIIGRVGEYCGVTRLVQGRKWITDNALFAKSVEPGFSRQFLALRLQHFDVSKLRSKGGQPLVSQEPIYAQRFAFPPRPEQEVIVSIVSTWDRAIETVEALITNARAQKKALMQSLLTGERRLPGFSEEWPVTSLGQLGETYGGLAGKSKADFGQGHPFITYKNVFDNAVVDPKNVELVTVDKAERQHRIRLGDILFTTSSETPNDVGMSSVVAFEPGDTYLNSFCFGFRPNAAEAIVPGFAAHFFRCEEMRTKIAALAQGSTRYNISKGQLLKLRFALPDSNEQQAIAQVLDAAESEIGRLTAQLAAFRKEKSALMQQLLTGKRRVKLDKREAT